MHIKSALLSLAAVAVGMPAAAATYSIDPAHTYVNWEATHFGTSTNRGRFDKKEGTVEFDPQAKSGKVSLTIQMDSINTGFETFNGHLKGENFFNVAAHPTAKFESDQFVVKDGKVSAVKGQLTLLGKTQPVTLEATRFNCYPSPIFKREVCGGDFVTTLKRSEYGMTYGLPGIPDDIRLLIQVEAVKQ